MARARLLASWSTLGLRGLGSGFCALLLFVACGDDDGTKKAPDSSSGGGGSAGESAAAGGSSAASTQAGDAATLPGVGGSDPVGGANGAAGEASGGASPAAGLSLDDFCELMTVRAPQWLRDCRNLANAEDWWGNVNVTQLCTSGREAVDAGRLVYDPVQAKACAALSVGDCSSTEALAFGVRPGNLRSTACFGVLSGTLALGDECHPDSTSYADECAEGFCAAGACPSECTAYASNNDDCDGLTSICDPTALFCNAQGMCQPFVPPGDACPNRNECAPGDVCHSLDDQTYLCTTPIALAAACAAGDLCANNSVCLDGECRAEVALGDACITQTNCPDDAFCNGTCLAYVALDGDCTLDVCEPGLLCSQGVCVAEGQVGDDCPCEVGLWCDDAGKCQAPRGVDDDCSITAASSCPVPLFCHPQTLKCSARAAEDDSCSMRAATDSCQAGLHCVCTQGCANVDTAQGVCEPRAADDADCTVWHDCASGVCTQQKCAPDPACY